MTNNLKLDEYIREIIQTKLKEFGNNKEKTSQALNISRSRLNRYLK
ncbi:helix-turn-helix domain-containing protein [Globicatella sanguinis]|nr:helix-turn-helix domain-containing protein [Globicatella sanguinis]MDK7631667.1 helix-turn-helix domain-containing protein [Globicatella sanguinis]WIK65522.1 helix-turn-helix domain-containing protein [Globicatella sanguinis]WKT54927.1 helix-turn-helix domain-containing protein [Globicatella sanguinis]